MQYLDAISEMTELLVGLAYCDIENGLPWKFYYKVLAHAMKVEVFCDL